MTTTDEVYWTTIRAKFPILNQSVNGHPLIYLDNAATSQMPQEVIDAFTIHHTHNHANIHRGIHALAERSTAAYETARAKVARFIGARSDEIIFTHGTTESSNLVAHTLLPTFSPGDEIVVTEMDHHSNFVMWQELAKRHNLVFKVIPITPGFRLDIDAARNIITARTRIVAIPHVSNVLGTINPVRTIADMAHEVGALIYVDGAQAIAHMPIDVIGLGVDFYAFSGHKMYGPTGIGVLYARESVMRLMPPFHYGGGMIEEVSIEKTRYTDGPARFEAGTPNIAGAICLGAVIDFLDNIGMEKIHEHEATLTRHALNIFVNMKGIALIGPQDDTDRLGVFSIIIDGMHAHDAATALDETGIAVRAGHHCAQPLVQRFGIPATVRASVGIYTTEEEIDAFIDGLRTLVGEAASGAADPTHIGSGLTEEQELYRENIIDHYRNPHNKRRLENPTACKHDVNPSCGDTITVHLLLEDGEDKGNRRIIDVGFDGKGCAISQAAMSMLTDKLRGMASEEVSRMTQQDILMMLGIPIGIVRMKCAMLGLRTTQSAIRENATSTAQKNTTPNSSEEKNGYS